MHEARQNWHRFRQFLGSLAPVRSGLLALHSGNRIIFGSLAQAEQQQRRHFDDWGMNVEHPENVWEVLAHKYQVSSVSFVEREALLMMLADLQRSRLPYPRQMEELRKQILQPTTQRARLVQHFGEKPSEQAWPRSHFFLKIFDPLASDLLPERKLVLLAIRRNDSREIDTILLEFSGRELRNYLSPDWTGVDMNTVDIFHKEGVELLIQRCENHYMLPCFAFMISQRLWEEAQTIFLTEGPRATWKKLLLEESQREHERELLIEPKPWPLRACLRWNSWRG